MLINIDNFLLNNSNTLTNIPNINPSLKEIMYPFCLNQSVNIVKYKNVHTVELIECENFFIYNIDTQLKDIISNIQCNCDHVVILNGGYPSYVNQLDTIALDTVDLTLPLCNIKSSINIKVYLKKINSINLEISYDVYTLSDTIRENLMRERIINNQNNIFCCGSIFGIYDNNTDHNCHIISQQNLQKRLYNNPISSNSNSLRLSIIKELRRQCKKYLYI